MLSSVCVPIEKQLPDLFDITAEFLYFILAVVLIVIGLKNHF